MAIILNMKSDLEKQATRDLPEDLDLPDADDILTQEMMNLSVKDRNDMQEEMHGVKCLAIEESPEMVEKALFLLKRVIDEFTPDCDKRAYLQSQQPPKEITEHQRILNQLEPHPQQSYANGIDFRLRFLRCDLFDVKKAAKRLLKFLDLVLELFGDYALRRPIRLSDFSKEEIRFMKYGRYQIMPNRDRAGRRVYVMLAQHGLDPRYKLCPRVKVSWPHDCSTIRASSFSITIEVFRLQSFWLQSVVCVLQLLLFVFVFVFDFNFDFVFSQQFL